MASAEKKAVLYARVSKVEGDQNPETQLKALREWALNRHWAVVAECSDRISGDPSKRAGDPPGLRKALEIIARRRADVLVIFAADRLVRSPTGLLSLVARVQSLGGHVASYQDGSDLDTTTDMGELMLFIRGWFARMELKLIRARTVAGLERAKAAGKVLGRPRVELPDLDVVRALKAQGHGYQSVAKKLGCSERAARNAFAAINKQEGPR